jgi:hypothetical protein
MMQTECELTTDAQLHCTSLEPAVAAVELLLDFSATTAFALPPLMNSH